MTTAPERPQLFKLRGGDAYNTGGHFVIADRSGCWLGGCYDTLEAAQYAIRHRAHDGWRTLQRLQDEVNVRPLDTDRVITLAMLKAAIKGE